MAITINVSHLLLFSGPCPSQVVAHSGSSYAHFSSSLTHLKITPTNSLNTHATSHSNTVSHIHTSGTTLYPLLPFFLWGTAYLSSLCSKLIAFLMTIGHRGFFAFYPFPILQSVSQKPKQQIWQPIEASHQDRMDGATKLFNTPEKRKNRHHSIHPFIYIYIYFPPFYTGKS